MNLTKYIKRMMIPYRKGKLLLRGRDGMTMVEVTVAFVMLILVMVILYGSIKFSSNMVKEAIDLDRGQESFEKAVQTALTGDEPYELTKEGTISYTFKDPEGTEIPVQVSTACLMFRNTNGTYTPTDDETQGQVRKLYLFSTKK